MATAGGDADVVGTVGLLARYPVKSTAGEQLDTVAVAGEGLAHDRQWAVYTEDGGLGSGKTTRRFRKLDGLLGWRSGVSGAGVELHSPTGSTYPVTDPAAAAELSRAFGQPLELRQATDVPHHDDCPVHLVTTSSLRSAGQLAGGPVDPLRLRANLVLMTAGDGFVEDGWSGSELAIGPELVLLLGLGMPRCVMVDQPQVGVTAQPPVLKVLGEHHDVLLGLQASVLRPGTVALGDLARLRPAALPGRG